MARTAAARLPSSHRRFIGSRSKSPFFPYGPILGPDTGINEKGGKQHVSFGRIALEASRYALVFSFDQSFSRKAKPLEIMRSKLAALQDRGCHAMYYNSHARFLFVTTRKPPLHELRAHLISLGLPQERLLESGT
ncbi:MAG: hypothetical protein ABSH21_04250 [Verrucomicrobiia bacterium]